MPPTGSTESVRSVGPGGAASDVDGGSGGPASRWYAVDLAEPAWLCGALFATSMWYPGVNIHSGDCPVVDRRSMSLRRGLSDPAGGRWLAGPGRQVIGVTGHDIFRTGGFELKTWVHSDAP